MNRVRLNATQQGDAFGQRSVDGYEGYSGILSTSASNSRSRIGPIGTEKQNIKHKRTQKSRSSDFEVSSPVSAFQGRG